MQKCIKFEHLTFSRRQHIIDVVRNVMYYFVGHLTDFPAVKKFGKSYEIIVSKSQEGGAFFVTQCSVVQY